MYRSHAQVTGTNVAPLAAPRRWGGAATSAPAGSDSPGAFGGYGAPSAYTSAPSSNRYDSGPPPPSSSAPPPPGAGGNDGAAPTERKRKSRWGAEGERVAVAGLPVAISGKVDAADLDRYAGQ